jgi:hypothetical protein
VSGFLNFDEKIIATTIKLAHAKVSAIKLQTESTLLKQIINRFQIKRERNESTTSRKDDDSTVADSVVATTLALPAPKT